MTDIEALEEAIELLTKLYLDGTLKIEGKSELGKVITILNKLNYNHKLKLRIDNHVRSH